MSIREDVNTLFEGIVNQKGTLEQLKRELDTYKEETEKLRERMKRAFDKMRTINIDIANFERNKVDYYAKIMEVENNEKIVKVAIDADTADIVAETKVLYARAKNGGTYLMGRYEITFSPKSGNIKFINLDDENRRRSCWGDKCHHPHVDLKGKACLGNASEMIAYLSSDYEYQALFDILVAFLEAVNLEDTAGRHVMNWTKVDPETHEILHEGYYTLEEECFSYGDDYEDDEVEENANRIWCSYCEEYHDEEDAMYIDSTDEFVCDSCRDEYFFVCGSCDTWHHIDERTTVADGVEVCDSCLDEDYYYCDDCEEYHHMDNTTYIDNLNKRVCDGCLDDNYFKCEACGNYFEKDNMYLTANELEVCKECFEDTEEDEREEF